MGNSIREIRCNNCTTLLLRGRDLHEKYNSIEGFDLVPRDTCKINRIYLETDKSISLSEIREFGIDFKMAIGFCMDVTCRKCGREEKNILTFSDIVTN